MPGTTVSKALAILEMFSPGRSRLTLEEVIAHLGTTRATGYRYLRDLSDSGFLARSGGGFTLGPKIIELDRRIRDLDPLLLQGRATLGQLAEDLGCDVMLVAYYSGTLVVTHRETGPDAIAITFDRGSVLPIARGAGSKIILAHLPLAELRRLYRDHAPEFAAAGLGESLETVRRSLTALKRVGHAVSAGELDPGLVGIARAIRWPGGGLAGVVLAYDARRHRLLNHELVLRTFKSACADIEADLQEPSVHD